MTTLNPIADAVEGLISPVVGPLMARLIDLIPDPAEKARQAALAQQALMAADAQIIEFISFYNLTVSHAILPKPFHNLPLGYAEQ